MSLHESATPVAENTVAVREQLYSQGYSNVPVGITNAQTHELFDHFKDFVALTEEPGGEELKTALAYKGRREDRVIGNESYFIDLRVPGEHNPHESTSRAAGNDHKYIFHFGPRTIEHATRNLGRQLPKIMELLLEHCSDVYYDGRKAARLGSAALGLEGILFNEDPAMEVHHLRLIDYIASNNGEHAEAHFDRGVTTLALNESHPGLRGLPADNGYLRPISGATRELLEGGLQPVSHLEGVGKFFASAGLRRLPEDVREENALDDVPLFAHDVVNEKPGVNRQAVVMFFNPHLEFIRYPEIPSKEETSVSY